MCKALTEIKRHAEKQGVRQGIKQGVKQGIKQGIVQGNQRNNKLIQLLLADGRQDDLLRSTTDAPFQQKLFQEYHI